MIGKALLPETSSMKNRPSQVEADVSETKAEIKEEAPAEPAPAVNLVPKAEVSEGALS